ncbi:MAG: diacylglycerol kinase family protein [Flavobacterium sp.]|nr:MAG: diacylglycerol kinase family protein [Flavobacterium sp.]
MDFEKDNAFFTGRMKSMKYAAIGAWKLITTEHSIMAQLFFALVLVAAGFYYNITRTEWMFQILATGLVLAVEGLNTALEKICDFVHPGFDTRIGFIKDISAGAVMFAAIAAIATGLVIYVPKFL